MELFSDDVDLPAPEVDDWLMPAWRCWWRLHHDRPWHGGGFGPMIPGRIPWRDIRAWCEFHDLPGEDCLFIDECCRTMDATFAAWHAERSKRAGNA